MAVFGLIYVHYRQLHVKQRFVIGEAATAQLYDNTCVRQILAILWEFRISFSTCHTDGYAAAPTQNGINSIVLISEDVGESLCYS